MRRAIIYCVLLLPALTAHAEVPLDLVVMVDCPGGSRGAGVIFKMQGDRLFVVTADHVVRKGRDVSGAKGRPLDDVRVYTHFAPGVANSGKVVRRSEEDPELDLAIIEVAGMTTIDRGQIPLDVLGDLDEFRARAVNNQAKASVVGWHRDQKWNYLLESVKSMRGEQVRVYSPTFLDGGASGGAIFDDRQQLVGILQEYVSDEQIGRGLSIGKVLSWVKKSHPVALRPRAVVPAGWTDVFADDLKSANATNNLLLVHGQYTNGQGFVPKVGRGLWTGGGHESSAAWPNCALKLPFGVAFDFAVEDIRLATGGQPVVWLRGPGYGVSKNAAIVLRLEAGSRLLIQQGDVNLDAPLLLPEVLDPGDWYHLDLLVEKDHIRIGFQGRELGTRNYAAAGSLEGPLHAFVGLGSFHGLADSTFAVAYRNLEIRRRGDVRCADVARALQPDPMREKTGLAESGARVFFDATFPGANIGRIATSSPEAVTESAAGLSLFGVNALPVVWLDRAVEGDFEVDVEVSYPPVSDSVNFYLLLARADHKADGSAWPLVPGPGLSLAFPGGDGNVSIRQFSQGVKDLWEIARSPVLAETPFYAPVNGRMYHLRLVRQGTLLQAFSNGGLLVSSSPFPRDGTQTSYYVGLGQIYYGHPIVRRIRAAALSSNHHN